MTLPVQYQDVWEPATAEDKKKAFASLSSLPSRAVGDPQIDRASYYTAIDGVTRYGLAKAVKAILQGSLNHGFYPSPPELRKQCDAAMEPHERMAERIRRVQRENAEFNRLHGNPVVKTEESKARVAAIYERFCKGQRA